MNRFDDIMRFIGKSLVVISVWVAFVLFVNFIIMPIYTRQGTEIRVPDIRGMSLSDARNEFGRKGFRLVIDDERYVADAAPGTILDQFPGPGGWTKKGRRIHLAVAAGTPSAEVPDVIGMNQDDAFFAIQSAGLNPGQITYVFNDTLFEGLVGDQFPIPGNIVDRQSTVFTYVSMGNEPSEYLVPNVVNLPEDQARYLILKAGLKIGKTEYDAYVRRRNKAVVIQKPIGGLVATKGDSVALVVNRK
jgi:eukaryotic-like serine/threonine-protein kinase